MQALTTTNRLTRFSAALLLAATMGLSSCATSAPKDTFGLTVSQTISIAVVVGGVLWLLILQKMPLRSSLPAIRVKKQPEVMPEPAT